MPKQKHKISWCVFGGEEEVRKYGGKYHIVRIQLPFTDEIFTKKSNLPRLVVQLLSQGKTFSAVVDAANNYGLTLDHNLIKKITLS